MSLDEIYADTELFLNSRNFEVEHAVENLVNAAKDIADYRLQSTPRSILMTSQCRVRIALALDALQITYDDLEGKYRG